MKLINVKLFNFRTTSFTSRTSFSLLRTLSGVLALLVADEKFDRTVVNETKIENRIGDAIVHRIIKAHHDGTPWKCCIVIPLLPGFTFPVDHSDASAVS